VLNPVENALGRLVVANYNSISSQAEDISYASGVCEEKLGLKGKAITVAASHL